MNPERFEDRSPLLLAGLRRRHSVATAEGGIADQWREFLAAPQIPNRSGSAFYGVICGTDGASVEYLCGVEVQSFGELAAAVGRMRVPAQRYAVFSHPEGFAVGSSWRHILQWLADGPYDSAHKPDFEQYSRAPLAPADLVGVEIWVGVVERSANSNADA